MKTLNYILAGVMLIIMIPLCNSQSPLKNEQVLTLKSVTANTSGELLAESAEILSRRMTNMNIQDVQITQVDAKAELVITVRDTIDRETLLDILLTRGAEFL